MFAKNICEIKIKPKKKQNHNKILIILFLLTAIGGSFKFLQNREHKKQKEIARIESKKNLEKYPCEQYALFAID